MTNIPDKRGLILPVSERHLNTALAMTSTNELGRSLLFARVQPELASHIGALFSAKEMEVISPKEHQARHAVKRCLIIGYDALALSWLSGHEAATDFPTVTPETVDCYREDPEQTDRSMLECCQPDLYQYAGLVFNGLTRANDRLPVDGCMDTLATMYGLMEQQLIIEGHNRNNGHPQL